jgi:hypothetical protein
VFHPRHRPLSKDAQAFLKLLKAAASADAAFVRKRGKHHPALGKK